jgi:hypothetical protein
MAERGGINGRKIKFISRDDSSNPKTAVEHTGDLSSRSACIDVRMLSTPSNLATRAYSMREYPAALCRLRRRGGRIRRVSGTMGWQPTFRAEGRIYANYIQSLFEPKIAGSGRTTSSADRSGDCEGLGITANDDRGRHRNDVTWPSTQVDIQEPGAEVLAQLRAADLGVPSDERSSWTGIPAWCWSMRQRRSRMPRPAGLQNPLA